MNDLTGGELGTEKEESVVMGKFEATFDVVVPVTMKFDAENMEMAEEFMNSLVYKVLTEKMQFLRTEDGNVHKVQQISDTEINLVDIEEIEKVADLLGKNNDKK